MRTTVEVGEPKGREAGSSTVRSQAGQLHSVVAAQVASLNPQNGSVIDARYVLVGGWPASGKSTLANALARQLRLPWLAKDEIKEAMADALGHPTTVAESQQLGQATVRTPLRIAGRCPAGAVLDSTWYPYTLPLVHDLQGHVVEVRCVLPREMAKPGSTDELGVVSVAQPENALAWLKNRTV